MSKRTGRGRGGKREGAGRPAGAPNTGTVRRREQTALAIEDHFGDGKPAEYHLATIILKELLDGTLDGSARVTAAIHLDNRLQGKPREALELSGPSGGPIGQHIFRARLASGEEALAPPLALPPAVPTTPAEESDGPVEAKT
jgi:hypothetical protein